MPSRSAPIPQPSSNLLLAGFWLSFLFFLLPGLSLAAPKVQIAKAAWSAKKGMLTVKVTHPGTMAGMAMELLDSSGRLLASETADGRGKFRFRMAVQRPELLCSVRVRVGNKGAEEKVTGTRNKDCLKAPQCQILSPANGTVLSAHLDVSFQAKAKLKDRKAGPLKLEWDFGGGAMGEEVSGSGLITTYKRPYTANTTVQFVRDNSRYRVRFTAMDGKKRYCEDAVEVTVGTPPETPPGVPLMAARAEQSAPKLGSQLEGKPGDLVVLPFEDWTQQSFIDMPLLPRTSVPYGPNVSSLNVQVYQKAHLPVALRPEQIDLSYTAASNPADPAGAGSINTTSQNWPLNADLKTPSPLLTATIQKTDVWERTASTDMMWAALPHYDPGNYDLPLVPIPDEGYALNSKPGSDMPGIANPYAANDPQAVNLFDAGKDWFTARMLPVTDVDDAGRVNPFPLFRLQARLKGGSQAATTTDAVLSNSRDLHCRECHEKGGIAADPNAPYTPAAFHSSAVAKDMEPWEDPPVPKLDRPEFFAPASASPFDRERAAAMNIASLHEFYDDMGLLSWMQTGCGYQMGCGDMGGAHPCQGCHGTTFQAAVGGMWYQTDPKDIDNPASPNYWPLVSIAEHRFHGELQWNADKTGILRDTTGKYLRWDYRKGPNPNTLAARQGAMRQRASRVVPGSPRAGRVSG